MGRKKYHVTKTGDGKWQGKAQGGQRASVKSKTKEEAVRKTIEIAKKQQDSQVIIHKQDGKIQEERTYGNDPHPPKDRIWSLKKKAAHKRLFYCFYAWLLICTFKNRTKHIRSF